ncbi:MAG: DNA gyrase inhibitor YacG [Phycisphaerae bacterium]
MTEKSNNTMYKCRKCATAIELPSKNKFFPFCSERCKLADLNGWLEEDYKVIARPEDEILDD